MWTTKHLLENSAIASLKLVLIVGIFNGRRNALKQARGDGQISDLVVPRIACAERELSIY